MKTLRVLQARMIDGTHREVGELVMVPDDIAKMMVRGKVGEEVPGNPPVHNADTVNVFAEAINPLVPDADPRHTQVLTGTKTEDHPGLIALDEAEKIGAPKRADPIKKPVVKPVIDPVVEPTPKKTS